MTFYLWAIATFALLAIVAQLFVLLQLASLRRSGRYPQRGKATMADVERLLSSGLHVWALRCYREVHGCSLRQAKEAVDGLSFKR